MNAKRLEIARLSHRFAFGPRPGEFAAALAAGVSATRQKVLTVPATDAGAALVVNPLITDLGVRPKPNTPEIIPFVTGMRNQTEQLTIWWLDRMAMSDHGLSERMAWFWHGHWATSITKVDHPLAMYKQNQVLRQYALGNFAAMSRAMVNDAALQYWLDGQTSTVKAPNENLARELMELFILGVNRYTEDDVKALARVLTGYQLSLNAATVLVNPKRRDMGAVTLLGQSSTFTAESASDYLVAKADCATFIAERLWYRFISSTDDMPKNLNVVGAFASREVAPAVASLAQQLRVNNQGLASLQGRLNLARAAVASVQIDAMDAAASLQAVMHSEEAAFDSLQAEHRSAREAVTSLQALLESEREAKHLLITQHERDGEERAALQSQLENEKNQSSSLTASLDGERQAVASLKAQVETIASQLGSEQHATKTLKDL